MNNYNKFTSMNIQELSTWLDKYGQFDGSPWTTWFDNTYCSKCEGIEVAAKDTIKILGFKSFCKSSVECSYCEIHHTCRFFPGRAVPNNRDIIEMWLQKELEEQRDIMQVSGSMRIIMELSLPSVRAASKVELSHPSGLLMILKDIIIIVPFVE